MTQQEQKQERIAKLGAEIAEKTAELERLPVKQLRVSDRATPEQRYFTSEDGAYLFERFYNDTLRIAKVLNKSRMVALRDLAASAEAMRGALETFVEWFWGKESESANELFERIASEFKRDTGYLRPGKDGGMVEQPSYEERSAAWNEWIKAKREAAEKLCREVLAAHPK